MIRTFGSVRMKESEVEKQVRRQCLDVRSQNEGGANRNKKMSDLKKTVEVCSIDLENNLDMPGNGAGASIRREERIRDLIDCSERTI